MFFARAVRPSGWRPFILSMEQFLVASIALIIGAAAGWALRELLASKRRDAALTAAARIRDEAEREAKVTVLRAKEEALKLLEDAKAEERERRKEMERRENLLAERERAVSRLHETIERKTNELEQRLAHTEALRRELSALKEQELSRLGEIAHLSQEEAKAQLFARLERTYEESLQKRLRELAEEGEVLLARRAQDILLTAIQRYGASHAVDATTSTVAIPSEELKGRIIGKEGRNIKAFERATGCEVLVDDTPGAIVISSFDPIRREVARRALERLIEDGRIQPARIEELVEASRSEVEEIIRKAGADAVEEVGVGGLDPRLIYLLGRLRFRTSFGQNVLQHSIEAAHLAGMIAAELHADIRVAKLGALLHDIGKAVDHEVEGTHVEIGRKLLKRFGIDEEVIKAMQSHHEEYPFETPESIIVKIAEAISAARPGARRDTVENYLRRLADLERIANSFEGVEKSYAIQAGREIRVFVLPDKVDDATAETLARNIADKIEQELHYPGEIKVTVIREKRVVEYAK